MLEHLSIQQRFRLLLVVSLVCFALCGVIVFRTLAEIRVNGPIYERIMQGQDLVADVLPPPAYLVESYLIALQLSDADAGHVAPLLQRLQTAQQTYQQRHRYWRSRSTSPLLRSWCRRCRPTMTPRQGTRWRGWPPPMRNNGW
jgi:methyl-accepting chemotaxis protein